MSNNVNSGEINTVLNSSAVSSISDNMGSFGNISTAIGEFCDNTLLKGEIWDNVKNKLHEYTININKGVSAITEFMTVVKEELNKLATSFGEYAETIDISKEAEVHTLLEQTKGNVQELKEELAKAKNNKIVIETEDKSAEGEAKTTLDYGRISDLEAQIGELETKIVEMTTMYELIVKVKTAYENAFKKISAAYAQVVSYVESGMIEPSGKYVYNK